MSRGYGFVSLAVGNQQGQWITFLSFPPSRGQIGKSSRSETSFRAGWSLVKLRGSVSVQWGMVSFSFLC